MYYINKTIQFVTKYIVVALKLVNACNFRSSEVQGSFVQFPMHANVFEMAWLQRKDVQV